MKRGDLKAFYDDQVLRNSNKMSMASVIKAFSNLESGSGLILNYTNTFFLTVRKDMRGIEEVKGIKGVDEAKYLVANIMLNRQNMI